MQLPTIHNNGTSKASLIEALVSASEVLNLAYQKITETAPNGRDYYPQGSVAMNRAIEEHQERLKKIDEVKGELDAMTIAIDSM